jgi:hypothetical protein
MATTEDIFERLVDIQNITGESLMRLETEVRELRDSRLKPYFASGVAFLMVVMGVMSYVYALETRLTSLLFTMNAQVNVSDERLNVLEDRLEDRSETMRVRWEAHSDMHVGLSDGIRILVERLLNDPPSKSGDSG